MQGEDLAIVLVVVVPSDNMQCNVKCKVDFDDLESISQQKTSWKLNVVVNIFFFNLSIVLFIINSLHMWKLFIPQFWFA